MHFNGMIWVAVFIVAAPDDSSSQAPPSRAFAETFRIGGIDAPSHAAFSREPGIAAAADGTIFVRHSRPPFIAVFGPEGRHLRTIGREGQGPGEFDTAFRHGLLSDTLWVIDNTGLRISFFDFNGKNLNTSPIEWIDHGRIFTFPQVITAVLQGPYVIAVPTAAPVEIDGPVPVPVFLGNRSFSERREVAALSMPRGMIIPGVGSFALRPPPVLPLVSVASSGIGFVTVTDDTGEAGAVSITRFNADGGMLWRKTVRSSLNPISPRVRDSLTARGVEMADPHIARARNRAQASGIPVPRGSTRDLVAEALNLPSHYPPFDYVRMGRDGGVWLRRGGESSQAQWLALSPNGEEAFTVRLSRSLTVQEATLETIWGTIRDALDVPYVVRLDVT